LSYGPTWKHRQMSGAQLIIANFHLYSANEGFAA
jgi:hypothetical protein